jgi:hypothetical protein
VSAESLPAYIHAAGIDEERRGQTRAVRAVHEEYVTLPETQNKKQNFTFAFDGETRDTWLMGNLQWHLVTAHDNLIHFFQGTTW